MKLKPSLLAAIIAVSASASAALYYPNGVQTNVPVTTVTGGEWTLVYQGLYSDSAVPISTVFAGVNPGDYLLYAAKPVGATEFTLLAAAPASDVRTHTSQNETTLSNGVEWYYNGGSIGFAAEGDAILQNSADIAASSWAPGSNGHLRLSWHTAVTTGWDNDYDAVPLYLFEGWRAGSTIELNDASNWERYVFVSSSGPGPSPIPEPGSFLALGGLLGIGLLQRGRRKSA